MISFSTYGIIHCEYTTDVSGVFQTGIVDQVSLEPDNNGGLEQTHTYTVPSDADQTFASLAINASNTSTSTPYEYDIEITSIRIGATFIAASVQLLPKGTTVKDGLILEPGDEITFKVRPLTP